MLKIYGIKNCDTVRKALKKLNDEAIEYEFHDFKKAGLEASLATEMINAVGADKLLNKRGTTWRNLSDDEKAREASGELADLLSENSSLVKRPVWQKGSEYRLGFAAKDQDELLAWASAHGDAA